MQWPIPVAARDIGGMRTTGTVGKLRWIDARVFSSNRRREISARITDSSSVSASWGVVNLMLLCWMYAPSTQTLKESPKVKPCFPLPSLSTAPVTGRALPPGVSSLAMTSAFFDGSD